MMRKTLAVAIPTWRRPVELGVRLRELVPQLRDDVGLWVFENGRTEEVARQMEEWPQVKYCPSSVNRGIYRNVLRCFEEVDAEWVWVLGDDDSVHPDAVERALALCTSTEAQAVVFRSFSVSDGERVEVKSLETLMGSVSFSEALFLTGTVWRRDVLVDDTQSFMEGVYSMSAHLMVLCRIVATHRKSILVVGESLVTANTVGHRWSRMEYTQRSATLLDLFSEASDRRIVARWMEPNWWWAAKDSIREVSTVAAFDLWRKSLWRGLKIMRENGAAQRWLSLRNWSMGLVRCCLGLPARDHFLFAACFPGVIGVRVLKGLGFCLLKKIQRFL